MTSSQTRALKKKITCYNCIHLKGPTNIIPKGRHIEETYVCGHATKFRVHQVEVGKMLIDTLTGSRTKSRDLTVHTTCKFFDAASGKFEDNEYVREEEVKNKLTNEEYLEYNGTRCPKCQSEEISIIDCMQVSAGQSFQDITCNDCNEVWTDHYKLTGYSQEE
jgi:hypothetical protein